jgi:hypothetical protein
MPRILSLSISLVALILAMPAVQARQDATQIVSDLKREAAPSVCSQIKVLSSDSRYIMVTATPNQSAADDQLRQFVSHVADRAFGDKDAELLVVFFESSGTDHNVRSVSVSRENWESMKSGPSSSSALAFTPADEASDTFTPALDQQRIQLADRIETLKKKGVGVEPYLKVMQDYETDIRQGADQAAREKLASLSDSIDSQEKQLASRGTVRLRSSISQVVSVVPAPSAPHPTANAAHPVAQAPAPAAPAQSKQPDQPEDAYTLMKKYLGMSSINDLGGQEKTAADRLYLIIAAKSLGADCPDIDGPFLMERVRIALRIQELEHQRVQSYSYRDYNRDKIEALVRARNPRYMRQIAENIQYLERQIGVKELDRPHVR